MAIANFARPEFLSEKLDDLSDVFHLTGSKFFVGFGEDTDYFVQDRPGLTSELSALGMYSVKSREYKDNNCVAVYRYRGIEDIDVQVVVDAELKLRVQNKFKELGIYSPTQAEWNLAFKLLA